MDATALFMLQTMWRDYERDGMRLSVVPPPTLTQTPPAQPIGLGSLPAGFFFAEITGRTGSAYSWKDRVETAAGTWADGLQTGALNAYYAQPGTPSSATVATGALVLMRASPALANTYEFQLP